MHQCKQGSMMASHLNPQTTEYGVVLRGSGTVQVVFPNGTTAMSAAVAEGDVFWIPRYFPFCQAASHGGGPMEFFGFTTSTRRNRPQFLVGASSVLRSMRGRSCWLDEEEEGREGRGFAPPLSSPDLLPRQRRRRLKMKKEEEEEMRRRRRKKEMERERVRRCRRIFPLAGDEEEEEEGEEEKGERGKGKTKTKRKKVYRRRRRRRLFGSPATKMKEEEDEEGQNRQFTLLLNHS